jgi:pescadillo protein
VAWDGAGSAHAEGDEAITHAVVDRPTPAAARLPGREYVQPQWLFDSLNFRIRCPAAPYAPGVVPPPHLSPFAADGAAGEGYAPDFADTVRRGGTWGKGAGAAHAWRAVPVRACSTVHAHPRPPPSLCCSALQVAEWQAAAAAAGGVARPARVRGAAPGTAAAEGAPAPAGDADEASYAAELAAELAGVPFSAAAAGGARGAVAAAAKPRGRAAAAAPAARLEPEAPGAEAEALALSHVLLPRKSKELYKAMQMGRQKKAAATGVLRARKAAAEDAQKKR